MERDKWSSRKLAITLFSMFTLIFIPVIYKQIGISETVTLFVITSIAGASGLYNAANAVAKKYGSDS